MSAQWHKSAKPIGAILVLQAAACSPALESTQRGTTMATTEVQASAQSQSPVALMDSYSECVKKRDVEGIVALYEADASFIAKDGATAKGHQAIRGRLQGLMGIQPVLRISPAEVQINGDLAVVRNEWTLSGVAPDGSPIEDHGNSLVILRRSNQGTWRIAIDRP